MCVTVLISLNTRQCSTYKREKNAAILINLGQEVNLPLWDRYVRNIEVSGISSDIYVNARSIEIVKSALSVFGLRTKYTIQSVNMGMDIGGFFISLMNSRSVCTKYDFIMKLHSKRDTKWMRKLVDPLLGVPSALRHLSNLFKRHDTGQVFVINTRPDPERGFPERLLLSFELGDTETLAVNTVLDDKILASLGIDFKRTERFFMAGTMFALSHDLLTRILPSSKLSSFLFTLNTPTTFDAHWFSLMTRNCSAASELELPGNSLFAHHKPGYLPDGQKEHGWERVLSYLSPALGLQTYVMHRNRRGDWTEISLRDFIATS